MVVELKNGLEVEGVLHSVDQFLNVKLGNIKVLDPESIISSKPSFINLKRIINFSKLLIPHYQNRTVQVQTDTDSKNHMVPKSSLSFLILF